ncbi:hypothetical protein MGH68_19375 [Erysipelothrix sp. D19-032]
MYYDKNVFTEEDVKSLDSMIKVVEAKNKKIFMDVSNGRYNASFFLGAGGKLAVENGKQVTDFNNARGLQVGEYMRSFTLHQRFLTGDDTVLQAVWAIQLPPVYPEHGLRESMEKTLGDNYVCDKTSNIQHWW